MTPVLVASTQKRSHVLLGLLLVAAALSACSDESPPVEDTSEPASATAGDAATSIPALETSRMSLDEYVAATCSEAEESEILTYTYGEYSEELSRGIEINETLNAPTELAQYHSAITAYLRAVKTGVDDYGGSKDDVITVEGVEAILVEVGLIEAVIEAITAMTPDVRERLEEAGCFGEDSAGPPGQLETGSSETPDSGKPTPEPEPTRPAAPTPTAVSPPTATAISEPLCQAINYKKTSAVEDLIEAGVDVNARCESQGTGWYDGVVPLHIAVSREWNHIVQLLLDAGADTGARGNSPLCRAVNYGFTETVSLLVEAGADIDERCQSNRSWYQGTTPTAIADKYDRSIVQQILQDPPPASQSGPRTKDSSDRDREALTKFFESTGGSGWTYSDNWLTDESLARWYGVTTDDNGRVTELSLFDNQLTGSIPDSLSDLSKLRWLDLSGNALTGPLPEGLQHLSQLRWLYLSNNELSGPIGQPVWKLSLLRQLELENNRLTGPIPQEMGQLSNLKSLHLGNNQLTGPVPPELGDLRNLIGLHLFDNQLSGPIPSELGNLGDLRRLQFHSNQLSGPIPGTLGNLDRLALLTLHDNALSGNLPRELGDMTSLRVLLLHNNQFTGQIPDSFGNFEDLVLLSLHDNLLEGEIPKALGKLTNLVSVSLFQGTDLIGEIPDGIDATIEGVEEVMKHLGGPASAVGDLGSTSVGLIRGVFFGILGFFGLW